MKRLCVWLMAGVLATLAGCATPTKMAFQDDSDKATTGAPVYLMTVTVKNEYHESYQPRLFIVHVEKAGAKDAADKLNFKMDDLGKAEEDDSREKGNSYLLRMRLQPGSYELVALTSRAGIFPVRGFFITPLVTKIEAAGSGIFYLGHITATVRERQGNEFKAGPSIPLIDQAVLGASGGTFDVDISDQLAADEPAFRAKFPALAGVTIQRAVLPPFDRAKAQKWWEDH